MATLSLKNINKIYANNVQAVYDFNLEVKDKEFIVLVGPSGCGKSTTLRMIAGLEEITSGKLIIDGKTLNDVAPKDRDIAMVFQNYALYPHMTVYDNMAFALKLRKLPMPLFIENEEVNKLRNENKALIKKAHVFNRKFKKNQNDLSILAPRAEVYKQIYANLRKIESLQKPLLGKNEYKIAVITKNLEKINAEIENLNNQMLGKFSGQLDKVETLKSGIAQRKEIVAKLQQELEYYKNNDVPLTKLRNLTSFEIEIEINKTADSIDLTRYLFRKPSALSGGQRQRVALGRAIVRKPRVFLMDEPLSNLDAKLRVQTRSEISKIHERVGATTIYVTHDQTEAMTMADRIVVMKDGYIQQIGTPTEIYNNPANMFVAGFIGAPATNFISGVISKGNFVVNFVDSDDDSLLSSKIEKQSISIKLDKEQCKLLKDYEGKEVVLGVRPECIYLKGDKQNSNPTNSIKLESDFVELLDYELVIYTFINGQKLILKTAAKTGIKTHDKIEICFDQKELRFFDKDTTSVIK